MSIMLKLMVAQVGLEPTDVRFKVQCLNQFGD